MRISLLLFLAATCFSPSLGRRFKVELDSDYPWQFVAKFVYDKMHPGHNDSLLRFSITGRPEGTTDPTMKLEMRAYNDLPGSWEQAAPLLTNPSKGSHNETCRRTGDDESHSKGPLRWRTFPDRREGSVVIPGHYRPRVWYLYVASVDCTTPLQKHGGSIEVTMQNPGGFFEKEIGADRQWVLETLIAASSVFFVLFVAYIGRVAYLRFAAGQVSTFHPIMQHYAATVLVQLLACVCLMADFISIADKGEGIKGFGVSGYTLDMIAQVLFLLLIIVFAMGFLVVHVDQLREYESVQKRRIPLFFGLANLVVIHAILIYSQYRMDAWNMDYPYTTTPGIILAMLRVPILAYYIYCLHCTIELVPARQTFYVTWGFLFSFHITILPIILVVALLVDPWVRFKVVFMIEMITRAILLVGMAYLLWPGDGSQELLFSGYERVPLVNEMDMPAGDSRKPRHNDNADDDKSENDGL